MGCHQAKPATLDPETRKAYEAAIARRWLAEGKVPWLTLEKALAEVDKHLEGASLAESLALEKMSGFFRDKIWAEGQLKG